MKRSVTVCTVTLALLWVFGAPEVVRAAPDLYVSEFSLTPATPVKGNPVAVRVGVYNRGTARSGAFTVEWWPGENYTRPALRWRVDGMNARGGRILTGTYPGYPSRYAKITTKAVVDSGAEVAEDNEGNNERTMEIRVLDAQPAGRPDLHVSEFSLTPATPVKGSPVAVRVGVYNRGTARSGAFAVEWWPGENYTRPALRWRVDGMNARGGRILTDTYAGYPSRYAKINTKAVVDSGAEVAESAEGNNERTMEIRVLDAQPAGRPDLYISEFSLDPPTPTQGQPVRVRIGVYNKGTAPAGAFKVTWWAGKTFTGPAFTWSVDGLPARGGRILTTTYAGYRSWYARMMTAAVADSENDVPELDEANNEKEMRIRVQRP